jgi:hypothetical protein
MMMVLFSAHTERMKRDETRQDGGAVCTLCVHCFVPRWPPSSLCVFQETAEGSQAVSIDRLVVQIQIDPMD